MMLTKHPRDDPFDIFSEKKSFRNSLRDYHNMFYLNAVKSDIIYEHYQRFKAPVMIDLIRDRMWFDIMREMEREYEPEQQREYKDEDED